MEAGCVGNKPPRGKTVGPARSGSTVVPCGRAWPGLPASPVGPPPCKRKAVETSGMTHDQPAAPSLHEILHPAREAGQTSRKKRARDVSSGPSGAGRNGGRGQPLKYEGTSGRGDIGCATGELVGGWVAFNRRRSLGVETLLCLRSIKIFHCTGSLGSKK